ncbi:ABC transporter ATP-binding protein [Nocardioides mangrovicus]|uniref:ABC transporter ATP-binding protein n=1 Tax=Nocardioides mangrovicus TaxID=2478913 RepID=A0A3L8P8T6_9ACTN|nr:ABC transporter ATP-binding protein [Nocardioides mangrovicus]RLV50958.1 ABC transporter ATP-binding protein [Nocardioides mangrovicus]
MTAPILEVEHLGRSFGKVSVIEDLSFDLAAGQTLGIVGPNGAGKSTLLNLVGGVLAPSSGRIRFEGQDVTRLRAEVRARRGIGRSFQVPRPFGGLTVLENLLVAARFAGGRTTPEAGERALQVLETTGLLSQANAPAGSLRLLDRKRLELARGLASGPRLLLLDEIAGGLTEHEVPALVETVREVKESGVTVVWIEHVVHAVLAVADQMMCLTYGRMLALGEPQAVMNDPEVRRVYLGSTPEEALG